MKYALLSVLKKSQSSFIREYIYIYIYTDVLRYFLILIVLLLKQYMLINKIIFKYISRLRRIEILTCLYYIKLSISNTRVTFGFKIENEIKNITCLVTLENKIFLLQRVQKLIYERRLNLFGVGAEIPIDFPRGYKPEHI